MMKNKTKKELLLQIEMLQQQVFNFHESATILAAKNLTQAVKIKEMEDIIAALSKAL